MFDDTFVLPQSARDGFRARPRPVPTDRPWNSNRDRRWLEWLANSSRSRPPARLDFARNRANGTSSSSCSRRVSASGESLRTNRLTDSWSLDDPFPTGRREVGRDFPREMKRKDGKDGERRKTAAFPKDQMYSWNAIKEDAYYAEYLSQWREKIGKNDDLVWFREKIKRFRPWIYVFLSHTSSNCHHSNSYREFNEFNAMSDTRSPTKRRNCSGDSRSGVSTVWRLNSDACRPRAIEVGTQRTRCYVLKLAERHFKISTTLSYGIIWRTSVWRLWDVLCFWFTIWRDNFKI